MLIEIFNTERKFMSSFDIMKLSRREQIGSPKLISKL